MLPTFRRSAFLEEVLMFATGWLIGLTLLWFTAQSGAPAATGGARPPEVNQPEPEPRYLALSEALAMSLEDTAIRNGVHSVDDLFDHGALFALSTASETVRILSPQCTQQRKTGVKAPSAYRGILVV